MIARIWHGWTKPEHADVYESHLKPELLPGLGQKKGFRGAHYDVMSINQPAIKIGID